MQKNNPIDFRPLRHLIGMLRKHDLTHILTIFQQSHQLKFITGLLNFFQLIFMVKDRKKLSTIEIFPFFVWVPAPICNALPFKSTGVPEMSQISQMFQMGTGLPPNMKFKLGGNLSPV